MRSAAAAILLAAFIGTAPGATTPLMSIDEIRPGMTGIGRTVFEGSELQDFTVHILGVLRNVQGPRRDLILARLEGGPLGDTGVAQGMSGSPVYIDGRLIGAVSYSIGAFSKEPIAGITPIGEMKDATAMPRSRPAQGVRLELPITRENLAAALSATSGRLTPFASRPADVQAIGIPAAAGAQIGAMLRPISTPLLMSGFEPEIAGLIAGGFHASGFTPVITGSAPAVAQRASGRPLREGDAVGVTLIGGDLEMGATGTITHIDGDRVYGFGHPLYNLGPTEFPMTRAHVHAMLPSLMISFKISSLGETIGTMHQDRATAIAGTLGKGPELVPMTIRLESVRGSEPVTRTVRLQLVKDQLFTPLLSYVALFNTLGAYERQYGAATIALKSRTRLKGHGDLTVEDVFAADNPILGAATAVAGPLSMMLGNNISEVTVEALDVTISATETPKTRTIERVWLDDIRPRAGRTVNLKVLTRGYRGDEQISTVPLEIPANAPSELTVLVSDGRQLNALEQREMRGALQPQTIAQLVKVLNDTRRNNRIYIRLLTGRAGAVVNGEAMTALPPSVLAVLEADKNGGSFTPIRSAALGKWEIATDSAVSGSRTLTINLEAR